ncbi:HAD family hydrolase [Hazenella coriacea]|uniref:HAD superfamily hydrolase (TIGR01549 family) n=1 Tax=Hazenella coriacea TaxID=1179467 RepID=A0A4R3LC47_9BACL|nr:HAD family hydrolase [Hazenella coriacea]TCS96825.1 HAD superfamily hydrolase (TIGR01549 family) [Hazenella coriacea]
MIKACLFDLDGTLLPMDTHAFVETYMKAIAPYVKEIIPPDKLIPMIWKATLAMIESDQPELTNEQVFKSTFESESRMKLEKIWPLFEKFYEEDFPKLQKHTGHDPVARQVVEVILEKGYHVAVATNPVFPRAAIVERMRWAGVHDLPFKHITVYEDTYHCKPREEYYLEVADRLGVHPEECVMVGNDMQEDMVASSVGMKTYYVNQYRIDRGKPIYTVDQEGSLKDLLDSVREGKGIFAR